MTVVSNTSPLCYLILLGQDKILPQLFGSITIPFAVRDELQHEDAPLPVREWMEHPPDWLIIREVFCPPETDLAVLHAGEREAILLAEALRADLVILDEKAARQVAERRKLVFIGLLGLLSRAALENHLNLPETIGRVRSTNFRASPRLLKAILDRHQARG